MSILGALATGPKSYSGPGVNHENEAFVGTLLVESLEGGRAVLLRYAATLSGGEVVHSETTLLGTGTTGKLCLWPVMSEIPVVIPHEQVDSGPIQPGEEVAVFASGARGQTDAFREEITITTRQDKSLVYAHAWGLPGGAFEARSSCQLVPQ
jgi:hypothetical protein